MGQNETPDSESEEKPVISAILRLFSSFWEENYMHRVDDHEEITYDIKKNKDFSQIMCQYMTHIRSIANNSNGETTSCDIDCQTLAQKITQVWLNLKKIRSSLVVFN